MSGGTILRHACPVPIAEGRGMMWRCDCGRRWKTVVEDDHPAYYDRYRWVRRYLPWPRRPR